MPQRDKGPGEHRDYSPELRRADTEQGKRELLFVLTKFLFLKRAHGLNHKTNNMNIYGAKLSNLMPKKVFRWL